jgi:peptidoglycan/LPS O-acetylase OafA/YrhL
MTAPARDLTPPRGARFPGLDGLRGLGAMMVLTTHVGFHSGASLNTEFSGLLSRLDAGVAIFFVISGFLLSRPFLDAWISDRPRPDLARYGRNRVLRIVPALWLTVVLVALLLREPGRTWVDLAAHAALVQIYFTGHETLGLTQMWSLATEVAFYALIPLLVVALGRWVKPDRRGLTTVVVLLGVTPVLSAAWVAWSVTTAPHRAVWLPGHLGWFGLGMLAALWVVCRGHGVIREGWADVLTDHPWTCWGLAGGLYLLLSTPIAGPYSLLSPEPWEAVVKSIGYGLFATLLVLPATRQSSDDLPRATLALGSRYWRFLGDMSYGVFCYHLIVLHVAEQVTGYVVFSGGFFPLWFATVSGSVVAAWLSYRFVERPVMDWGRRSRRSAPDDSGCHRGVGQDSDRPVVESR